MAWQGRYGSVRHVMFCYTQELDPRLIEQLIAAGALCLIRSGDGEETCWTRTLELESTGHVFGVLSLGARARAG